VNHPQSLGAGGSDSWKAGELTRHLDPVRLAQLSTGLTGNSAQTYRVQVQGLCDQLTLHVAVGVVTGNPNENQDPILPADYPTAAPGPGTMQLTPVVKNPAMPRLYLREVFQDPTLVGADNDNHPLPEQIPFGWSFDPEGADEVRVDIDIPANAWSGTDIIGTLVCVVTASYTGNWQDPRAVTLALGRVRISPTANNLPTIGTGSE